MCFLEQHNIALPLIVLSAFQLNTRQSKPSYKKNWKNSGSKYMTPSICIYFESKYMLDFVYVLVAQACPTLCNPMDCSPPGSSIHGILQAWIQEWVAISLSRGSSQPRNQSWVSCFAGGCLLPELLGRPMLDFLGGLIYESARLGILLLSVLQISEWNLDISATVNIWTEQLNWTELKEAPTR